MKASRWQTVSQIFSAALDLPENERQVYIRQACGGDVEMESEVARLLIADENAGSFLESPTITTQPAQIQVSAPLLVTGSVVADRFRIVRFVGQGGMGQVYEAIDLELNSRIALKAIRPEIASDPRMLSRFRREVQLTRMITHPNVCRTFDIERHVSADSGGKTQNLTFLTMELLEGETLSARLRRIGRFTCVEALPLVLQMIDALSAAHAVGVIHRDFKPSNVLLVPIAKGNPSTIDRESDSPLGSNSLGLKISSSILRAVVTDFGLARAVAADKWASAPVAAASVSTSLTGDQALMGTLIYMAPEQFERGDASISSDIYSLGLVMFEMVTGQRPFADVITFAEAAKRLKQPAPAASSLVPDLDPVWDATIARCLSLDSRDRFETARQVAKGLVDTAADVGTIPAMAPQRTSSVSKGDPAAYVGLDTARSSYRPKILIVVAILAIAVSLYATVLRQYWMRTEEARMAEGSTVLVTNIQNRTDDERFDDTTELVRQQLLQSPYFSLMDSDKIHKTLGEMLKPADASLDPQTAREVAMRNGVRRVVFGTVFRVGDSYVLDLDIERPDNTPLRFRQHWENHWTWSMQGGSASNEIPSAFLDAVRDSSDWIRREIGESANDIAHEDAPPEDVTTSNWDALSDFAQAEKLRASNDNARAVASLRNAITKDPEFALGHARLGDILVSLAQYGPGYQAYEKAISLSEHRLTKRETYRIRGLYAIDSRNYTAAQAVFSDYTRDYPHDYLGWFYLGATFRNLGDANGAIQLLKKAVDIDSVKSYAPAHIARFDLILGDFQDAAKWIQQLRDHGHTDDADFDEGEFDFLQGKLEESEERFKRLTRSPDPIYRSYGHAMLSRLFAEQGRYSDAFSAIEDGLKEDTRNEDTGHRADKLLDRAYLNCRRQNYESCFQDIRSSLESDKNLPRYQNAADLLGQAAFEANIDDRRLIATQLRRIQAELPRMDLKPLSDIVQAHVDGEALLAEGQWDLAVAEFHESDRLESAGSDKEYLARALLNASEHSTDPGKRRSLKARALSEYSRASQRPGSIWESALNHYPGYLSYLSRNR